MKTDEPARSEYQAALPSDFYIPNYELFKQLNPLTKYLIKRALEEGLFGNI